MQKLEWKTEKRKVNDLIPYEGNPRVLTEKQKADLKKSLEKFGLVEIPAVNTDNRIIAGHQRLAMMKVLGKGEEEIDVRVPSRQLSEAEFREYLLRSNKNTGEWDWALLAQFNMDFLKDVGFDSKELDKLFSEDVKGDDNFDPDEQYSSISEPESKLGEIYELGPHRLMCGDATNLEHVEKLVGGGVVDMVFTDPPYNVDYQGGMGTHSQNKREGIENDDMPAEEFGEFMRKSVRNMLAVCRGVFYICMGSKELGNLKNVFESEGGHWQSFIIWVKNTFTLGRADWQNQYEPILYGWHKDTVNHYFAGWRNEANTWEDLEESKPTWDGNKMTIKLGEYHIELDALVTGRIINKKNQTDIWHEKKPSRSTEHPTMKPVKLVAKAIKASSMRDQTVIDLFGGSGSTLIACEELGRKCLMMELDPKYVDVIRKRYAAFVEKAKK